MDKELKELRKLYDQLEVPGNLDDVLRQAMSRERNRKVIYMRRISKTTKTICAIAASLLLMMSVGTNISPSLAQTLYEIPGIEMIARLVTVRDYQFESDTSVGHVEIPAVEFEGDAAVEQKINGIIRDTVEKVLAEQAVLDSEYKEAYLETGGTEEGYQKIETTVDYELGYQGDRIFSFELFKYQTLASAYNENFYYTFDLSTGEQLSLKDMLGDDFSSLAVERVWAEMQERMKANQDLSYDVGSMDELQIDESRSFYVDKDGQIVVVFAKYEVAVGYLGAQEFIVGSLGQ